MNSAAETDAPSSGGSEQLSLAEKVNVSFGRPLVEAVGHMNGLLQVERHKRVRESAAAAAKSSNRTDRLKSEKGLCTVTRD